MTAPILLPIITSAGLRPLLVRRHPDDQHGDRPDHAARRPQPLRHQRHRAGHLAGARSCAARCPTCCCMVLGIICLCIFPQIALFLPDLVMGPDDEPRFASLRPSRLASGPAAWFLGDRRHEAAGTVAGSGDALPQARLAPRARRRACGVAAEILDGDPGARRGGDESRFFRDARQQTSCPTPQRCASRGRGLCRSARSREPRRGSSISPSRRGRSCSAASTSPRAARPSSSSCASACCRSCGEDRRNYGPVDADLRHLFGSWFNRGFLVLRPIDWDTPASVLEKIIAYEAVHAIDDWDDLRQRLAPRRPALLRLLPSLDPGRSADLRRGRADRGDPRFDRLGPRREPRRDLRRRRPRRRCSTRSPTATSGLAGVSFGSFLIKQVAEDLKATIPNLKTFVTLSPVPGFAAWLERCRTRRVSALEPAEKQALAILSQEGWAADADRAERARPGLLSLAARYFLTRQARRRPAGRPGRALPSRQRRDAQPDYPSRRCHRPAACARRMG